MFDARRGIVVAMLALALVPACEKNPGPQVGEPVPQFTLPDLEGREHGLADFRGQVIVLNFWATWCPPCVEEMPSLEKLHRGLADKGLAVLALSVDERFGDIVAFRDKYDLTFTLLHDNGHKVSRKYQTFKYPETYIIDRAGRLKSKVIGPRDWAAPSVIRDLVTLLSEEAPTAMPEPTASPES
jgi:cytochrome c biogenesis protein CcmG/thiol:disulfide interchange protein DsbE